MRGTLSNNVWRGGSSWYRHGQMTIIDRALLESAACECYALTTDILAAVPARAMKRAGQA
jgi:hypothetical protein